MTAPLPREPSITVNGVPLDQGQALTVRVACGNFLMWLQEELESEPNDRLLQLYRERMREVVTLMHSHLVNTEEHG